MRHWQPLLGSKQVLPGQVQTCTAWLLEGAQLQAPTRHMLGKSETLPQHRSVSMVPPVWVQSAASPPPVEPLEPLVPVLADPLEPVDAAVVLLLEPVLELLEATLVLPPEVLPVAVEAPVLEPVTVVAPLPEVLTLLLLDEPEQPTTISATKTRGRIRMRASCRRPRV